MSNRLKNKHQMDSIDAVLKTLKVKSTCYGRFDFTNPWGLEIEEQPTHASFVVVLRGSCWLEKKALSNPVALSGGDLVLFPRDTGHVIRGQLGNSAITLESILKNKDPETQVFHHGGGGAMSMLICGCFEFEMFETNPLLTALPDMIHVKGEEGRAVPWLETTLQFLAGEIGSTLPGSETVVTHLTQILFIQAVRAHISSSETCHQKGLARALTDPQIGQALALMHQMPQESWTVESLAFQAGMSRAGFAARFRELVGEPPMQYLTRWRMHKAASQLHAGEKNISEIATQVGYEAVAAFSKAFKRTTGFSPGEFRQKNVRSRSMEFENNKKAGAR